ncbi:hypothetical protein, partial [Helicobacter sp. 11S02629-2]|uniref:hypothetical protein n=1 Tax=Helicobacter sp. 11S02629-2 TaxID=1476195 RepID=UPI00117A167F
MGPKPPEKIDIDKSINVLELEPEALVKLICAELGLTKAELSRRLNYDPAVLTRLNNKKIIKTLQVYRGLYAHNYFCHGAFEQHKKLNKYENLKEEIELRERKARNLDFLIVTPVEEGEKNIVALTIEKFKHIGMTHKKLAGIIGYGLVAVNKAAVGEVPKLMRKLLEYLLENYELKRENEALRDMLNAKYNENDEEV